MNIDSREDWLNAATNALRPLFSRLANCELPEKIRISCGFTSAGRRGSRIGECWSHTASKDGTFEIFIVPMLSESTRVLDILVHELVHAGAGLEAKHGPQFRKIAKAMHLEGKMKATVAGPGFEASIFAPVMSALGGVKYPHADLTSACSSTKKQSTRMLKCVCPDCGYTARTTAKWLDEVGAPLCPCNEQPMEPQ